ncbi:MAG: hypothetical protein ACFFCS_22615 [Candidatus Hodarchaeota archaeon]
MSLGFWITAIGILIAAGYFIGLTIKIKMLPRWKEIPSPHLVKEELEIAIEGGTLRGFFYTSIDFEYSSKRPGVLVLPRKDKKYPYFEQWGAVFAFQGYPTLVVEVNNKALLKGDFVTNLHSIMGVLKETLCKDSRVDESKIAYFAIEDSAEVAAYSGLDDDDVKAICCMGMSLLDEGKISNKRGKVFLTHCENDEIVPVEDFRKNCEMLGLNDNDYLLLKFGGHHFLSQEPLPAAFFCIRLREKLQPEFKQFVNREVK